MMGDRDKVGWKWAECNQDVKRRFRDLARSESQLAKASIALGKFIDPGDQKEGETISLWISTGFREENLFQSTKTEGGYVVKIRATAKGDG